MKTLQFVISGLTLGLLLAAPVASGWAEDGHDSQQAVIQLAQGGHERGDRGGERRDRMERGSRGAPVMGAGERRTESRPMMENRAPRTVESRDRGERRVEERRMEERRVEQRSTVRPGVRTAAPQRGFILDERYHHNRYYPPRGYFARELPYGYRTFHHHGERFFFYNGIWYQPSGVGFIVVAPPFGMVIPVLPPFYTTIWVGGIPYYYADSVYYVWRPSVQGYVVTEPPAESNVVTQSPGAEQFYVYPKNGQDAQQQAQDRFECHNWAVNQTGFDPSQPVGDLTDTQLVAKRNDYRRAITACLEARGYSVK